MAQITGLWIACAQGWGRTCRPPSFSLAGFSPSPQWFWWFSLTIITCSISQRSPFFLPPSTTCLISLRSPLRTYSISYPSASSLRVPASFSPYWEAALLSHNLDMAGCGACTPPVVPLSTCMHLCINWGTGARTRSPSNPLPKWDAATEGGKVSTAGEKYKIKSVFCGTGAGVTSRYLLTCLQRPQNFCSTS